MNRITLLLTVLLIVGLATVATAQVGVGNARVLGMGGAFSAIANDASALSLNPAAMDAFGDHVLTGTLARLYPGVDRQDLVGEGSLNFVFHLGKWGSFGVGWNNLFSSVYSENTWRLGWGTELPFARRNWGLKGAWFGLALKTLGESYDRTNFRYLEGRDDPNDPLFAAKTSAYAFDADVSLFVKTSEKLAISLTGRNLAEPNSAINTTVDGKWERQVALGIAYTYQELVPTLELIWHDTKLHGGQAIQPRVGLESWGLGLIGLRVGWRQDIFSWGLSYRTFRKLDLEADYAMLLPIGNASEIAHATHYLTVTWRLPANGVEEPDFTILQQAITYAPKTPVPGDEIMLKVPVVNIGGACESPFTVSLVDSKVSRILGDLGLVPRMKAGETTWVEIPWKPERDGSFELALTADDDGLRFPYINSVIDEGSERNNRSYVTLTVAPLMKLAMHPDQSVLHLKETVTWFEEQPIFPAVFFDAGSTTIKDRYQKVLETIAQRLADNPDFTLQLRGYTFEEGAGVEGNAAEALAKNRARAVADQLKQYNPKIAQRIDAVTRGYDPTHKRAGKESQGNSPSETRMLAEENRRVEMAIVGKSAVEALTASTPTQVTDKVVPYNDNATNLQDIRRSLDRNPDALLTVKSGYPQTEGVDAETQARAQAVRTRDELVNRLGEKYADRVLTGSQPFDTGPVSSTVFVTGDGVIYKPWERLATVREYMPKGTEANRLRIKAESSTGFGKYRIALEDPNGQAFSVLAEGSGKPPDSVDFSWRDKNGNLIAPGWTYRLRADMEDTLGHKQTFQLDSLITAVSDRDERRERIFVNLFTFDEEIPQSGYLDGRIGMVAQRMVDLAKQPDTRTDITVNGHTDIVGDAGRNQQLSKQRADRELRNLRQALSGALNLRNDAELTKWLSDHAIALSSEGKSSTEPFVIERWKQGNLERDVIGDNQTPEGRTINRRVLITIHQVRGGSK